MEYATLNNGVKMPMAGIGTFLLTPDEAEASCVSALQDGYRLIDTAACYGNEQAVGEAIRESGLSREELFLASKVWIQDTGYDKTMRSFEKTLRNLQTDYLDLYLIHMPYGDYHGSWRAMEELHRAGKVKAIGVCNFLPDRLVDLILSHEIIPAVNQIELHPFCQQRELRRVMSQYHIAPMAWAPFAEGQEGIFQNTMLTEIGAKYGKTPAQVILRWLRQEGVIAIPKSVHTQRIQENFAVEGFELAPEDMVRIGTMDRRRHLILDVPSLYEVYRLHDIQFEQ